MSLAVRSPVAGVVVGLDSVPDPVFSGRIVGPGVAVAPDRASGEEVAALAPVGGTIAKIHPHAYIITTDEGRSVLVHLGLDTVGLGARASPSWPVRARRSTQASPSSPGPPPTSRSMGSTRSSLSSPWRAMSPHWGPPCSDAKWQRATRSWIGPEAERAPPRPDSPVLAKARSNGART